jgi:hypothetical protein
MSLALPALLSDVSSALAADAPLGHALRVLASLGALVLLATLCCAHEAAVRYARLRDARAFDLDAYIGAAPSLGSRAKVVAMHALNVGAHRPGITAIPLAERASPHMRGLRVTLRAPSATAPPTAAADGYLPLAAAATGAIVVGTIRMGFGHHRIAYAAASWGVATGRATYFHDLLAIESAEAKLISDMDRLYSQGSRLASELGGAVERMWGALTKSGDADALRVTYQMAEHLRPLLLGYDRDTPLIATHCLVGLLAVACGFRKVVNLVIDNHAQWFIVVPGALNLVQGPSNYHALLKLGVPASQLRLAGHWIPKDLVDNLAADCAARVARATARAPLRVLLPVGGAGAQRSFICKLVAALVPAVAAGRVQLLLNAGDHGHMREAFVAALAGAGAGALPPTDAAPAADGLAPLDALPASRRWTACAASATGCARGARQRRRSRSSPSPTTSPPSRRPTSSAAWPTCSRASRPSSPSTRCPS